MLDFLRPILTLLCGVALMLLGSGLLNTLIPVRASALGYSAGLVGALTSAYFVGYFAGTLLAPALIRRIGHIRAFALYSACCTCIVLLHTLGESPTGWLLARLLFGVVLVGLYTVIESWLNAQAAPAQRGRVFATYMVVNLGALALAQQFVQFGERTAQAFVLAALLICAASIPVLLTRQMQPMLQPAPRLQLKKLFAAAPSAGIGALLSGLAMGAFWGLLPVYFVRTGLSTREVGTVMSTAILGGACLQWPIGRFSDHHDRRLALAMVSAGAVVLAVLLPLLGGPAPMRLALIFLYGGMVFTIYPIVVAHLIDHLPPEDLLAASGSALLLTGIGSALGPLVAGLLMSAVGNWMLFAWFATLMAALAIFTVYRMHRYAREPAADANFLPMLRTSHASLDLISPAQDTAGDADEAQLRQPPVT